MPYELGNLFNSAIITGGLVPRGAYNAGTDYAVGDSVDYQGSSYVMYEDAAAGTLPTDTTKWQVLANKGNTGAAGADGADGSDGAPGDDGPPGADGDDGLSAYEVAVDEGFVGDEAAWLASLVGPAGADGADGVDGIVQSIGAGTNVTVDDTDPANPIVSVSGGGDVVGPATSTDSAIVLYDGTTGELLKDSQITVAGGNVTGVQSVLGIAGQNMSFYSGDVLGGPGTDMSFNGGYTDSTTDPGGNVIITGGDNQDLSQRGLVKIASGNGPGNLATLDGTAMTADRTVTFPDADVDLGAFLGRSTVVTSGNVTAGDESRVDYVYLIAGAHTVTLPTAVANANRYSIKNNHSANVTVDTTSSETIDGTTSISLAPEEAVDIISNNTSWCII